MRFMIIQNWFGSGYNERRSNIFAAQPNLGHKAIAELEKYVQVVVLTQNIDGLHQKAGSSEVLELHGSIVKISVQFVIIKIK